MPLTAKAEPFDVSDDTVTLSPLAVSVPVSCESVPTTTFPKAMFVGVTASVPKGTGVPVPLSGIDRFGFDAFETIETLPLSFPEEGGVNVTVKV